MNPSGMHRNLSMLEARRIARKMGVVEERKSNGEARFRHPDTDRHVTTKGGNRKDCPRRLLTFLRQLARGRAGRLAPGIILR